MCWTELVNTRIKARRQILFSKEDPLLQPLTQALSRQNRRTVVLWALEQAESSVVLLARKYPGELRPQEAVDAARAWSAGYIKMPLARQAILSCHSLAKELDDRQIKPCATPWDRLPVWFTPPATPWVIPSMR